MCTVISSVMCNFEVRQQKLNMSSVDENANKILTIYFWNHINVLFYFLLKAMNCLNIIFISHPFK